MLQVILYRILPLRHLNTVAIIKKSRLLPSKIIGQKVHYGHLSMYMLVYDWLIASTGQYRKYGLDNIVL